METFEKLTQRPVRSRPEPAPLEAFDFGKGFRLILGLGLVLFGILTAYELLTAILSIINGAAKEGFMSVFYDIPIEARTFTAPAGTYEVPGVSFTVAGYLLLSLFVLVAARMVLAFLKGGIELLLSDRAVKRK